MDAGMGAYKMKRPGQIGRPLGMPESNRSQMLDAMGTIDVSAETPINDSRSPDFQQFQGPPYMNQQLQYPVYQQGMPQQLPQPVSPNLNMPPMSRPYLSSTQLPLYNNGNYSQQMYQQGPIPPKKPYAASTTSRSGPTLTANSVKGFFKKGWRHNKDDDFADDEGVDLDGDEMTYDDLPHLRMGGPYREMPLLGVESSAPYIPTILSKPITATPTANAQKLSNTEYRKQVTAAKKVLYMQAAASASASTSRAQTLQGDPRLGNLQPSYLNDPRAMSLNASAGPVANHFSILPPQLGPRLMSLTNNGPRMMQPTPMANPQQQQQMRVSPYNSPYQQHPPMFNGPYGSTKSSSSNPRLDSLSQLSGSVGQSAGSWDRSANTSQQSLPEDKPQVTPTGETFPDAYRETDELKPVLNKINFNSSPERLPVAGLDFSPEKPLHTSHKSPLKSVMSTVSSEDYHSKSSSKLYGVANDNDNSDVFVTASQFSLQDIEEEDKLQRDETIRTTPTKMQKTADVRSPQSNRLMRPANHSRPSSNTITAKAKGKNFIKRLSFGKNKPNVADEDDDVDDTIIISPPDEFQYDKPTMGRQLQDFSFGSETEVLRTAPLHRDDDVASSILSVDNGSLGHQSVEKTVKLVEVPKTAEVPRLNFTVEQLGIMQSNSKLLSELEMVSNELAGSISREFELDHKLELLLKGQDVTLLKDDNLEQVRSQASEIAKLAAELAEERNKRYIAEEHVLRWENGMTPSILDLNYKQSEQDKRLVEQSELIKEYQSKLQISTDENIELLTKIERLQNENNNLKGEIVPNLQNQITILENDNQSNELEEKIRNLKLNNEELRAQTEQIKSIEDQKHALRDALKSMKENYERELKLAHEKIKSLERQDLAKRQSPLKLEFGNDSSLISTPSPSPDRNLK